MKGIGYRKYRPPADPLVQEAKLQDMVPLPGWAARKKQDALAASLRDEITRAGVDQQQIQAIKNAYALKSSQIKEEFIDRQVDKSFVEEFHNWILGKSKLNTAENNTPWGAQRLTGKSINAYLHSFVDAKMDFQAKLAKLKLFPPQTIGEAWLYYKYIVCKKEPLDEDYLTDFNYWTNPAYYQEGVNNALYDRGNTMLNPVTNQPYRNAVPAGETGIPSQPNMRDPAYVPKNVQTAGDPGTVGVVSTMSYPLLDAGTCVSDQVAAGNPSALNPPAAVTKPATPAQVEDDDAAFNAQDAPGQVEAQGTTRTLEEEERELNKINKSGKTIEETYNTISQQEKKWVSQYFPLFTAKMQEMYDPFTTPTEEKGKTPDPIEDAVGSSASPTIEEMQKIQKIKEVTLQKAQTSIIESQAHEKRLSKLTQAIEVDAARRREIGKKAGNQRAIDFISGNYKALKEKYSPDDPVSRIEESKEFWRVYDEHKKAMYEEFGQMKFGSAEKIQEEREIKVRKEQEVEKRKQELLAAEEKEKQRAAIERFQSPEMREKLARVEAYREKMEKIRKALPEKERDELEKKLVALEKTLVEGKGWVSRLWDDLVAGRTSEEINERDVAPKLMEVARDKLMEYEMVLAAEKKAAEQENIFIETDIPPPQEITADDKKIAEEKEMEAKNLTEDATKLEHEIENKKASGHSENSEDVEALKQQIVIIQNEKVKAKTKSTYIRYGAKAALNVATEGAKTVIRLAVESHMKPEAVSNLINYIPATAYSQLGTAVGSFFGPFGAAVGGTVGTLTGSVVGYFNK